MQFFHPSHRLATQHVTLAANLKTFVPNVLIRTKERDSLKMEQ